MGCVLDWSDRICDLYSLWICGLPNGPKENEEISMSESRRIKDLDELEFRLHAQDYDDVFGSLCNQMLYAGEKDGDIIVIEATFEEWSPYDEDLEEVDRIECLKEDYPEYGKIIANDLFYIFWVYVFTTNSVYGLIEHGKDGEFYFQRLPRHPEEDDD